VIAGLALASAGCQLLFGDYRVAETQAPALTLGSVCAPGTFRCQGAALQACAANRSGFDAVETCGSAGECDATAGVCHACVSGDYGCDGNGELQRCDDAGRLQPFMPCATPALCHVAGDRRSGTCNDLVCDAGTFTCDGNRLLRCAPGGDHLDFVARCASEPVCDAAQAAAAVTKGEAATCLMPLCTPGMFACDGATLERCNGDRNDFEPFATCDDAASCNPRDGTCTPAAPGTYACSGAKLMLKGGGGFTAVKTCLSPDLCDADHGLCLASACGPPGALRCGELPTLDECSVDGQWLLREACSTTALCSASAGLCFPQACELDATRCVGKRHERCSDDLTHWQVDRVCGDGQACNAGGCEADGCTEDSYRCIATSLERCRGGHWDAVMQCATSTLCHPTEKRCAEPTCGGAQPSYECTGDSNPKLQQCSAGRDAWNELRTCSAPTPVCNADPPLGSGVPECNACVALAYSCNGYDLQRCTAEGQSLATVARCPGGCAVDGSGVPTCSP